MKVGYSKTFPIYTKEEWEKPWLEVEISTPENLIDLSDEEINQFMLKVRRIQYALKKQVEGFHFESNKADEKKKEAEKAISFDVKPTTVEDINSCKDLKVLGTYRLIVKSNPELQEAYNKKLNELQ